MNYSQSPQVTCSTMILREEKTSAETGKSLSTGGWRSWELSDLVLHVVEFSQLDRCCRKVFQTMHDFE